MWMEFWLKQYPQKKILGVQVDSKLPFSSDIAVTIPKAIRFIGLIKRSNHCWRNCTVVVQANLEYVSIVRHSVSKKDIDDLIEKVQHRATRSVLELWCMSYQGSLKSRFFFPSISVTAGRCYWCIQILNGYYSLEISSISLSNPKSMLTFGQCPKLQKERYWITYRNIYF